MMRLEANVYLVRRFTDGDRAGGGMLALVQGLNGACQFCLARGAFFVLYRVAGLGFFLSHTIFAD